MILLNLFLTAFQSDTPLVPFLADSLSEILRRLKFFMLKNVVDKADSYTLVKLDPIDKDKCKRLSKVKLPTSAHTLLTSGNYTSQQIYNIKSAFVQGMKKTVLKLQERCPLKYSLLRSASSLSKVNMADGAEKSRFCKRTIRVICWHRS